MKTDEMSAVLQIATCSKCNGTKSAGDFYRDLSARSGLRTVCKACDVKVRLQLFFKIDVNQLWAAQGELCAMCEAPMLPKGKEPLSMVVDHAHGCCPGDRSCGKCVRGLLHNRCNLILGETESQEFLRLYALAQKYLGTPNNKVFEFVPGLIGRVPRPIEHVPVRRRPDYQSSRRYHIDFNAMWAHQEGKCGVCSAGMLPRGKSGASVSVDHDRSCCSENKSCGECVRGLVHKRCNVILGRLESPERVRLMSLAKVYLQTEAAR